MEIVSRLICALIWVASGFNFDCADKALKQKTNYKISDIVNNRRVYGFHLSSIRIIFVLMNTKLQTPIDYLKGVGPHRADLLRKELGIHTYQDLINFFPYRYIDRTRFYQIKELQRHNAEVQLVGEITELREVAQKEVNVW